MNGSNEPRMFRTMEITTHKYCASCNINFTSEEEFREHNRRLHEVTDRIYDKTSCPICQTKYKRSEHVRRHMLSKHTDYEKCPAVECFQYCLPQDLHSHMLEHVNATKFYCRDCNETFTSYTTLQQHQSTHLLTPRTITRFTCPQCFESYTRKDHMLRHIRSKHTEERVTCEFCSKKYRRKDHLLRHVREQHREAIIKAL